MKEYAELIQGFAAILWPLIFISLLVYFRVEIKRALRNSGEFLFEFPGGKFQLKPSTPPRGDDATPLPPPDPEEPLPFDYLYLNHTSFLRADMQDDFKQRTGVDLPHYDIRVVIDSYYSGALHKIERVEYILDQAFPHPIQTRIDARDRFLLKEIANGEFVLQAKIFLTGRKSPILLQRYITLWEEGPRLD